MDRLPTRRWAIRAGCGLVAGLFASSIALAAKPGDVPASSAVRRSSNRAGQAAVTRPTSRRTRVAQDAAPVAADPEGPRGAASAEDGGGKTAASDDILNLNLDQLAKTDVVVSSFDIPVNSVSRQESTVGRSAAAIFVITQDMIRRSGAQAVPELLRMVPGVEVAKTSSNTWAGTARGFNS